MPRRALALALSLTAIAVALVAPPASAIPPRHVARAATPGCADGQREAFRDVARYPRIAGCSGAWSIAGIAVAAAPACDRKGGDDGPHRDGRGCTTTDLCAPEWHVCRDAADVARSSPDGCGGAADAPARTFYATGQSGPGCRECATGVTSGCTNSSCQSSCAPGPAMTNDLFGCGTLGDPPSPSCGPLDRFGNDVCAALGPPWACPGDVTEANDVVKRASNGGGVLCCRD